MALVVCPECEKQISDRAKACPYCGFPMEEYIRSNAENITPTTVDNTENMICPKCGTQYFKGSKFCRRCGNPIMGPVEAAPISNDNSMTSKKDRISQILKYITVIIVSVVYMFPVTFFLTDVMPRISNDPITFEYEVTDFTFTKGMPYDDYDYMTIEQFAREFKRKIFNIEPVGDVRLNLPNPFVIRAYASENADDSSQEDGDETDTSNGRLEIFKSYIAVWNLWGHEEMEAMMPNGEMAIHAHNTFLQVAHDHGIIFGVYFVLFIAYVVILSLGVALRKKNDVYAMFCPVVLVCFVMAGLVEWLLHPCNPFGLTVFWAMMPLIYKDTFNEDEKSNQC